MIVFLILAIVMLLEIVFSISLFVLKHPVYGAIALSLFFVVNSALFFFLGQPVLGTIQLLVLTGGVSTYLVLGIASSSSYSFKHSNLIALLVGVVLVFGVLAYSIASPAGGLSYALQPQQGNMQQLSLQEGMPLVYSSALLIFAGTFGAVILFKRRY